MSGRGAPKQHSGGGGRGGGGGGRGNSGKRESILELAKVCCPTFLVHALLAVWICACDICAD